MESSEELLFLGGLDEGNISVVEFASGVVNILFKSVFTVLNSHREITPQSEMRITYLGIHNKLVSSMHLSLLLSKFIHK